MRIVPDEITRQPLDRVRRALLNEGGHAVEEEGDDCLIEVRTDGKGLEVHLRELC